MSVISSMETLFASEPQETVQFQEANGVWGAIGPSSWECCYYVYEVTVYHYSTLRIEKCIVNDPYARGYDPVLWGVPKGTMPLTRMVLVTQLSSERMVQALNRIGLRVAMDVAYNHVHGSGPSDEFSVLDKVKIVRGYYLRRDADGNIEN
ncbi:Pullulanase 1, chloroplastic-like protein, partial [Drosera capensis]